MADQPKPVMFLDKDMANNSTALDRSRRHLFDDRHSNRVALKGTENMTDTLNGMGLPERFFLDIPRAWRERGALLVRSSGN